MLVVMTMSFFSLTMLLVCFENYAEKYEHSKQFPLKNSQQTAPGPVDKQKQKWKEVSICTMSKFINNEEAVSRCY